MVRRQLGRSGLFLSSVGYGAFKIGRNERINYATPYNLPDDAAVARLLAGLVDAGINYFDTAPAYGTSEERLGRLLPRRAEVVISTKVGERFEAGQSSYDFSTAAVRDSLERSLRHLRREALDLVFVHAPGHDLAVLENTEVVTALQAAKQAGLVRLIGFSGTTPAAAHAALGWADALMVQYHLEDRSHAGLLVEAERAGVGLIVKKGLASGRLPAERAIPFVLSSPGVTSVVVGSLSLARMQDNIRSAPRST